MNQPVLAEQQWAAGVRSAYPMHVDGWVAPFPSEAVQATVL